MDSSQRRKRPNQAEDHETPTEKHSRTSKAQSEDGLDQSSLPLTPLTDGTTSSNNIEGHFDVPLPSDILLGRGKPFQMHPGNQQMLQTIHGNKERYSNAKRQNKRNVAGEVLDGILETGARFLKRVEGEEYWEEATRSAALDKVSHAIRSKRRKTDAELPRSATTDSSQETTSYGLRRNANEISLRGSAALPPAVLHPTLYPPMLGLGSGLPLLYSPPLLSSDLLYRNVLGVPRSSMYDLGVPRSSIYDDAAVDRFIRSRIVDPRLQQPRQLDRVDYGWQLSPFSA
jgi:hypothetical protein